jgi:hypothetical protein
MLGNLNDAVWLSVHRDPISGVWEAFRKCELRHAQAEFR